MYAGNTHRDFKNDKGKNIDVIENIENMEIERIELDKGIDIFEFVHCAFVLTSLLLIMQMNFSNFSGEQNINFSGAVHENNILSLLDQDYIEVIIHR